MNITELGAIGELVGGVAVLATLTYLAIQTRQTNLHAQASTSSSWINGWNELLGEWVRSESTIKAIQSGFDNFDTLSKSDQAIFDHRIGAMANHWLLAKNLHSRSLLSSSIFEECTTVVVAILSTKGGQQYWERVAELTPDGEELLDLVRKRAVQEPIYTDVCPWWSANSPKASEV